MGGMEDPLMSNIENLLIERRRDTFGARPWYLYTGRLAFLKNPTRQSRAHELGHIGAVYNLRGRLMNSGDCVWRRHRRRARIAGKRRQLARPSISIVSEEQ
jgi:hypothetical protein